MSSSNYLILAMVVLWILLELALWVWWAYHARCEIIPGEAPGEWFAVGIEIDYVASGSSPREAASTYWKDLLRMGREDLWTRRRKS